MYMSKIGIPLMEDNITRQDLDELIGFLKGSPRLTQSANVDAFEREWSQWVGVRNSVFVNSGSSANLLTLSALMHMHGDGEIIVPTLTWVSDIASVIQCGFKPVFVDIDPHHFGMDADQVLSKVGKNTRAVFLTHVLGFNGLSQKLFDGLEAKRVPLIEDVCESHGATFKGRRLGGYGYASNFSFYFGHHMSTIEGGMVCANDPDFYEAVCMLRSHGMVREMKNPERKDEIKKKFPDLNPDFIFMYPAWNMRSTEMNAVLGRSQLRRLDENNGIRVRNFELFLKNLDISRFRTDFALEGSVNYGLILVLREKNEKLRDGIMNRMREAGVEFRRGMSGGGNQLRQPYLRGYVSDREWESYPEVEHVHFFGFYLGNYPTLDEERILDLCRLLNAA